MASNGETRKQLYSDSEDDLDRAMPPSYPKVTYDLDSLNYNMNGIKIMYIFNHYQYILPQIHPRMGTESDEKRLKETFDRPDRFKVRVFNDYRHVWIKEKISEICNDDHSGTACIAIVVMTHGEEEHKLWAYDRQYRLNDDIINPLLKAKGLAGKPKLFFIQACSGKHTDPGHRVEIDGYYNRAKVTIPTHSDCLILKSSFEDHVSFRNSKGSWMIQTLCDVIDAHYHDRHLVDMMILVNAKIAKMNSSSDNPEHDEKRQICDVRFTFTKFLWF